MIPISNSLSGIIYNEFEKIPVGIVHVWDTSYTVPSRGFYVRYYSGINTQASGAIRRTQFESTLMHDWSNGIPIELSNYIGTTVLDSGLIVSDPFAVVYSGYFYADTAGLYNFATRSNAGTEIFVNNTQVLSGFQNITPTLTGYSSGIWPNKNYYWNGSKYLSPGWHDFKLNLYWNRAGGFIGNPFITAFYTHPTKQVETILSPSVINYQPSFLQPTVLPYLIKANENIDENLATQFDFEVACKISGVYTWNKLNEDFGHLKLNRLTKVFMGYVTESGYAQTNGYTTNLTGNIDGLLEKFTGMIDAVQVNQKKDEFTATAKCRDFSKKTINALNENYPSRANYTPTVIQGVDKFGIYSINSLMPNCYDRWRVFDVIETLALNSNIDPSKINRSKWDTANHFTMESNLNWPYTSTYDVNGIETKDGDPYLFKFEYGEKLGDELKRIGDLIGYNVHFDETGDLVVLEPRRTNRVEIYESGNYGSQSIFYSGNWNMVVDINASNRLYMQPTISTNVFRMNFSGVGCGIYQINYPGGDNYTARIYNRNSNQLVFSGQYTNNGILAYGVSQEFTRDLPFDGYSLFIYPSGNLRVEGSEYYTQNIYRPVYTIKDNRDASSINVDLNDYTLRNEVIAVGQQISDKGYLYSKFIDLDSISNPDAFNYVGEKRTFTLIEPTIQSQTRLDWLAQNIGEKFRRKQRNISLTTQGLPHLQINDPVGVKSDWLNLNSDAVSNYNVNNNEIYYVTNISSQLTQGNYTSNITLTSLKPIESWRPPLSITNDILNLIYQGNNNTIFANFRQNTLNSSVGYGYDGFSEQAAFVSFDLLVDVERLWVLIADTNDGGAVFKNIDVSPENGKNPLITYQIAQGNDPNAQPQGAIWLHNGGAERWGRVTVPTAQNAFNGGQWAGQNSLSNIRLDGKYPLAIWGQFRTSDNATVFQGIWVPPTGTIDSRNLTSGWSTSSSGNTYINYSNSVGGQSIQTPINPTLQLTDLPAFTVKNYPLEIDLWIGPKTSGYQMVSKNNLLSMTGNFQYHGQYWNAAPFGAPGQLSLSRSVIAGTLNETATLFTGILVPGELSYPGLVGTARVRVETLPWQIGDNVLFTGVAPTITEIKNTIQDTFYNLSITGNKPKNIFGWGPQGYDIKQRQELTGYMSQTKSIPGVVGGLKPGLIITSSELESVGTTVNYILLSTNHDIYLNYTAYLVNSEIIVNPINLTSTVGYNVVVSPISKLINVPFRGDLAIYLSPSNSYMYDYFYRDLNYKSYKRNGNVFNKDILDSEIGSFAYTAFNTPSFNGDPMILHYFSLRESKSGATYYFVTRTNAGIVGATYQGILGMKPTNYYYRPSSFTSTNARIAPRVLE